MRIALEIGLNADAKRGMDYFFRDLPEGLAGIDSSNQYALFTYFWRDYEKKRATLAAPAAANFRLDVRRWPQGLFGRLERRGVPLVDWLYARGRFDVYHGLGGHLPPLSGAAGVVTIHDLMPELFHARHLSGEPVPDIVPSGETAVAARRAAQVVTVSECTKRDLIAIYGIDPEKITPIHHGVEHDFFRPVEDTAALERLRRKHGLTGPFVFGLGPYEWRRNYERVIMAFAELKKAGALGEAQLALAGQKGAYLEGLLALARKLGVEKHVVPIGYAAREELPALYSASAAFCLPSFYEGFGHSVLEAMSCRTAVIVSNVSALPEVVGDAGLLVSPEDVSGLARALKTVLTDTPARDALARKAYERSLLFSWETSARKHLAVYEKAAKSRR